MDASGYPYVAGGFLSPTLIFDDNALTNAGSADMFLAKLATSMLIDEVNNSVNISAYPNPTSTFITLELPATSEKNIFMTV